MFQVRAEERTDSWEFNLCACVLVFWFTAATGAVRYLPVGTPYATALQLATGTCGARLPPSPRVGVVVSPR